MSLFITGTDTGVGKAHTATPVLRLLRGSGVSCAGMKPIRCGDRRDAELLLAAGSDGPTIEDINPIWLKTPAAPVVGQSDWENGYSHRKYPRRFSCSSEPG